MNSLQSFSPRADAHFLLNAPKEQLAKPIGAYSLAFRCCHRTKAVARRHCVLFTEKNMRYKVW